MQHDLNPNLILPIGTHVVTRVVYRDGLTRREYHAGTFGVIAAAPMDNSHAYTVRLADGHEIRLTRNELSIRKEIHRHDLDEVGAQVLADYDLHRHVIYKCIVGSRAYGLDHADSDTDRRGIYLPPAELHWSLYGVPEQLEDQAAEECYWEIQKFIVLALKANPNVLECLYTPLIEYAAPLANELLGIRDIFLSQYIYQTYSGYVMSQFKKLEQDLRAHQQIKWKHAMHLIRLLLSGITIMKERFVPVSVETHRDRLLAIKRGEVVWVDVNKWRLELHEEFDRALAGTRLPAQPNFKRANDFLLKARRTALEGKS